MKVVVNRCEFLACENIGAVRKMLADKGVDTAKPYAIRGNAQGGYFVVTQGDAKVARPASFRFGYCYSCKDVTEMAGEHCSVCECFTGML